MKGIILAGGTGTRLYPATKSISKHLLPIYDKPMIYYPLCTLMLAGLRHILIITTPAEQHLFKALFADGSQWGIHLEYAVQAQPEGIAQAFLVGKSFIADDPVCLILGDNLLYGQGLAEQLQKHTTLSDGAVVFGYAVSNPSQYGVVSFDKKGNVLDIIEKPSEPKSRYAVIGLYYYDNNVIRYASEVKPGVHNELQITDINKRYLEEKKLTVEKIGRGVAWLDTGTHQSMLDASRFISIIEQRQGLKLGCPEEIAWRMHYIDSAELEKLAAPMMKSGYGKYLVELLET